MPDFSFAPLDSADSGHVTITVRYGEEGQRALLGTLTMTHDEWALLRPMVEPVEVPRFDINDPEALAGAFRAIAIYGEVLLYNPAPPVPPEHHSLIEEVIRERADPEARRLPTVEDALRAEMWQRAKATGADIWTHLTDEQRAMIEARIAWALPGDEP